MVNNNSNRRRRYSARTWLKTGHWNRYLCCLLICFFTTVVSSSVFQIVFRTVMHFFIVFRCIQVVTFFMLILLLQRDLNISQWMSKKALAMTFCVVLKIKVKQLVLHINISLATTDTATAAVGAIHKRSVVQVKLYDSAMNQSAIWSVDVILLFFSVVSCQV